MTRDFAKHQLGRIQAFWPSLPATSHAVNEFVRALDHYTDAEIEGGVTDLIDTHLEPGAPKLGHIIAKVRARRPKTYETATEEERERLWPEHRRQREQQISAEIQGLEVWLRKTPNALDRYDTLMTELLKGWPEEGIMTGRKALHATVLRRVHGEMTNQRMRVVR